MEIKHVHPVYKNREDRLEQLKELRRICLEQVAEGRTYTPKQEVRMT